MDITLARLPAELADKIARIVHEMNMVPIHRIIRTQVVWTFSDGHISFWASEGENYYACLVR